MAHYYKYKSLSGTSFKYFVQMLLENNIYAPTFDQLNDPMEGAFLSDELLGSEIKHILKGAKLEKRIISLVKKNQEELPTNMLMWTHYSDEHKGCCIEFHFQNPEDEKKVKPVSYVNTLPRENQAEINIEELLTRKFCDWAYEQEVRHLGSEKKVPIIIDKIYLGMRIDNIYEGNDNSNEEFYRTLIVRLCPNANIQVEVMKAEDFDGNHNNTNCDG